MNLTIKINLDNDAFHEPEHNRNDELSRILMVLRQKLEIVRPPFMQKIFDINGNSVGTFKLEE